MEKNTQQLVQKLEAILFYLAEPVSITFLAKTLGVSKEEIEEAKNKLKKDLGERGLRVIEKNDEIVLVTAPELSETIENIIKEERERDLGKAGIETLSIIAYKGPVTKKEIEYIRGVNSQYALRNLLLRGLVERKPSKLDERVIVYTVTTDTVRFLGLSKIEELPEFGELKENLEVANEQENIDTEETE